MVAAVQTERILPGLAQQISTRVVFFIAGFSVGVWAPIIPYVKSRAALNEAQLGFLLLCLGVGSILTMPVTGMLASRLGCRAVISVSALLLALCLPLLATFSSVPLLAVTLFIFGAALGTADVTVNIQATIVEKASGRAMMSGFHGLYSVGGLVGASALSGLLWLGLSPLVAISFASAIILLLVVRFTKDLLPYGNMNEGREPLFAFPRGKVFLIGLLCFIIFLAEGSMLDWSALFLTTLRGVPEAQAGLGYAAFAIAMTVGRLGGDRIVEALGGKKILIGGGLCAAMGLGLVVLVPFAAIALLGFTMVGLGCSNIVPVLFTEAGRQKAMPVGLALSAITTIGYTGILTGPASIGFVAHAASLSLSMGLVALSILAVPLSATKVMARD
ncbi:inner membrane protein YbjJ [Abditibacteriota bacterium]|nr:inner membrane protein YbjJ [Abditibacteriota bacterium]